MKRLLTLIVEAELGELTLLLGNTVADRIHGSPGKPVDLQTQIAQLILALLLFTPRIAHHLPACAILL